MVFIAISFVTWPPLLSCVMQKVASDKAKENCENALKGLHAAISRKPCLKIMSKISVELES